jgi:hypothetical protein
MGKASYGTLTTVLVALAILAPPAFASEPLARTSLAGLSALGHVVATASADTVDETALQQAVEARLAKAGVAFDEVSGPKLFVNVTAERRRAEAGSCACGTYRVALTLREPVAVERLPGGSFDAITWHTAGTISRFGLAAPQLAIRDVLEQQISSFLAAVRSDTQKAQKESQWTRRPALLSIARMSPFSICPTRVRSARACSHSAAVASPRA